MKLFQLFFCQSGSLHDLWPRHSHWQQVAGYFHSTLSYSLFLAFNIRAIKAGVIIINSLNTFIVFFLLLTTQATNICQLSKMIEYLLLRRKRQSFQYFHILQYINPFFKTCLAFFLTLIKERKRKIDETKLVRKHRVARLLPQSNVCCEDTLFYWNCQEILEFSMKNKKRKQ